MMDITPDTNLLKSLRGKRVNYVLLISEGVDNSFDAGASRISIIVDDNSVVLTDNGRGVTKKLVKSIVTLGSHGPMETTQLGRFGIGIKSQAVCAGDRFSILSTSRDGRVALDVDWRKVLNSGRWSIEDPVWCPAPVDSPTGTTVSISELRRPPRSNLSAIAAELARRFYPAIADGKVIELNRSAVVLLPDPEMTDKLDAMIGLSDGRSAHIRAGLLTSPSPLCKVHVGFRHRVIIPESSIGCGEYGGLTKMFARVTLSGPWHLAEFKNDLTDEVERDELEDAVFEVLRPILEKCNEASMSAKLAGMSQLINDLLPPEMAAARPKKLGNKEAGSNEKKRRRSGFVDQDKSDAGGPARSRKTGLNKLMITFEGIADRDGVGVYDNSARLKKVHLSKDDPHVADLLSHRDEQLAARSLVALALAIYVNGKPSSAELPLAFGREIADLLSVQRQGTNEAAA